jgi:hypothetical protein
MILVLCQFYKIGGAFYFAIPNGFLRDCDFLSFLNFFHTFPVGLIPSFSSLNVFDLKMHFFIGDSGNWVLKLVV